MPGDGGFTDVTHASRGPGSGSGYWTGLSQASPERAEAGLSNEPPPGALAPSGPEIWREMPGEMCVLFIYLFYFILFFNPAGEVRRAPAPVPAIGPGCPGAPRTAPGAGFQTSPEPAFRDLRFGR